ncbi:hypothetical protein RBH94_06045 [Aestuariibaculum sp. YM273]|uniref:hypothetical protein n=1 Tax=Aestuariibaculum sp. YM273 TaxID=3070659 RepID=UPI0027DE9C6E|nr:hypothetical protein [Aestuariibaculum sp. YM273]WMI66722.1 hypothetical protein RBH94_06045 [Aestuariibaculum sp. YM273]
MRIQNKKILASILFVLISFVCMSQGPPPPPVNLPIDGDVIVGLGIALFYGANKLLSKKD